MTSPATLPTTLIRPPVDPPSTPPPRPVPLGSLIASARRLTATNRLRRRTGSGATETVQDETWEMLDLVGELRFLATTIAGKMGAARFYVGELDDQTDEPVQVDDPTIAGILDAMGDSPASFAQMVVRLGVNLFVPGEGYLVGIPTSLLPSSQVPPDAFNIDPELTPLGFLTPPPPTPAGLSLEDIHWRMLSTTEVTPDTAGDVTLHLGETEDERITCGPEEVFLIRVWRPHARRSWEADSPTRSSLPVLREIVGFTTKISAQIDSRLAGAGMLLVPMSAARALRAAAGLPEDSPEDPFTESLVEAMMASLVDRGIAAAVVPLVVVVPDESVEKFKYMTFGQEADDKDSDKRDLAIRRLALGQDAPPELLLGSGSMSHWGAWLSKEDVVTSHVEPPLALICDAITTQYLWPVLMESQGMDEETAQRYVVWYDTSGLISRPNKSQDAFALHAVGAITDVALRDATDFDESMAPDVKGQPPELVIAMKLIEANPTLLASPGLPQVVAQIRAALANDIPDVAGAPSEGPPEAGDPIPPGQPGGPPAGQQGPPAGGLPQTSGDPAPHPAAAPTAVAASAIVKAFEDAGPEGAAYIHGFIAQAEAAEQDRVDAEMRATYGGPGSGRYPRGSGEHPKGGARYPQISRAQLSNPDTPRTRAVTDDEFQQLATTGRGELASMRAHSTPPDGLDQNWDTVVSQGFEESKAPWGGSTVDAHTGKFMKGDEDVFILTVKPPGAPSVSVKPGATREEFAAGMAEARQRFGSELSYENHHLGIFNDPDVGRIDIDPVLVLHSKAQVDTIGSYTQAVGGAYNPRTGDGYWPPYVVAQGK